MIQKASLNFEPDYKAAQAFFQAHDQYEPSPLLNIEGPHCCHVFAKDETKRMGLGAFKALGAPYAVARILKEAWEVETGEILTDERLKDEDVRDFASGFTFVCASAGNHGMGVAAGALKAGAKARIHLAKTVPESFVRRLEALGASVQRSGACYEDSLDAANKDLDQKGAILLADGTWPGYTQIPKWVMEGYCLIAEELRQEFSFTGEWPTHVYLQAGVGGLAAAMAHMVRLNWAIQPDLIIVEPEAAACLQASHKAGLPVRGDGPVSVMGRLDCKDPSIVAFNVLERCNVRYLTISDEQGNSAAKKVTSLGLPTTPSGAAGYAALCKEMADGLAPSKFQPLVIISEGAA